MRRLKLAFMAGIALGILVAASGAVADHIPKPKGHRDVFIRWDLVSLQQGVALPGGLNVSTDAATGDTIELTGSGQAEPHAHQAFGSGTFVHLRADGTEVARGVYTVTGFRRWERKAGGDFGATGLVDGLGDPRAGEPTSGILRMNIQLRPNVPGTPPPTVAGVLVVFCHLPGTLDDFPEGVRVRVPSAGLRFEPDSERHGVTIHHRLR